MPNGNGSPKGKRKARSNLREILISLTPGSEYFVVVERQNTARPFTSPKPP